MKKTIITIILSIYSALIINAQIADGYYHIKNTLTGRYLSINDTDAGNYTASTAASVNLAGIRTYINYDTVAVSPSCVVFVKSLPGGGYDISGQGSSLYEMTNYKLPIEITPSGDNYIISGTYSGVTMRLFDRSPSDEDGNVVTTDTGMDYWSFIPINTTSEYIGIRPDVKTADGTYWGTIYAGFSFRLVSEGMTAFYISNAGGTGFTMEQIVEDVIPAATPVLIRCNSENVQDNKIEPVIGYYSYDWKEDNWLGGVYCSISVSKHRNTTFYDQITMRLLGLSDNGELAFVKNVPAERLYKEQYLMANKAYLKLNTNIENADVMTHGGYTPEAINSVKTDYNATNIYTLTGIRLPDGVAPKAGIYIKNGKKIIIR